MAKEKFEYETQESRQESKEEQLERAKAQKLDVIRMKDSSAKEGMLKALNSVIQDLEREVAAEKTNAPAENEEIDDPFSRAVESREARVLKRVDNFKDTGRA